MITQLPPWFKQEIPGPMALKMMRLVLESGVNTVCREAKCPNTARCFREKAATFMILGKACTRACAFCAVNKASRRTLELDPSEAQRIALFVKRLGLDYAVITSVARDDLNDGGAAHFATVIEKIRELSPEVSIEALIPDFAGSTESLKRLISAHPSLLAHNLETVERLYALLRPSANYFLSLEVLKKIKILKPFLFTKSSLMLGFGENEGEVVKAMEDLRKSDCDVLTLGQYLSPSPRHYPVKEFISPAQFNRYRWIALSLGFKVVSSAPLVRSSYDAQNIYQELKLCMTSLS